ncbi:hypothetical protein Trydic_g3738 [Trypoxylus dichotomus]
MTRDWQNVIFSDESSFWAFSPQRKAWSVRGRPMLQRSVKHPLKDNEAAATQWQCRSVRRGMAASGGGGNSSSSNGGSVSVGLGWVGLGTRLESQLVRINSGTKRVTAAPV